MTLVAYVLHVPLAVLEEMDLEDLLMWTGEAGSLLKRLAPKR